jgi:uncharacterized protein (DUF488 family)
MHTLATIGYERTTPAALVEALKAAGVEILVDVRAVASSRRPGFAKKALTAHLAEGGIEYLHLRGLGTPAAGRVAARAGRHEEMRTIFTRHLKTHEAQDDLEVLVDLVETGRRACLLCLEAEPAHCHRQLVADAVATRVPVRLNHLFPIRV